MIFLGSWIQSNHTQSLCHRLFHCPAALHSVQEGVITLLDSFAQALKTSLPSVHHWTQNKLGIQFDCVLSQTVEKKKVSSCTFMITSYTSSAISGAFRFDSEFTWKYMSFTLMKQGSMIQQEPTCHSCCWNTLDRIQNEIWTQYSSKHCSIIELQRRGIESIRLRERILGVFVEIGHSDPGRKLHDTKRKG